MIVNLEAAIRARLVADTTLTGYLGASTSIYNTIMPPASALPYIVYTEVSSTADQAMRTVRERVDFTVAWYVAERDNSNGYAPIVRARQIETRIKGDWHLQPAGTAPTYGLDRFNPDISASGWTAGIIVLRNIRPSHPGEGVMRWIATFDVFIAKAGA